VIECSADVIVKTQKATIDAEETEVTGNLLVMGKLTWQGAWLALAVKVLPQPFREIEIEMPTPPAACCLMAQTPITTPTEPS
jgi:hypothetical protein